MREFASAEEVADAFLVWNVQMGALRTRAYLYKDMGKKDIDHLLRDMIKEASNHPNFLKLSAHDKLGLIVKAAFISGFTNAVAIYYNNARIAYDELFETEVD